MTIGQLEQMAKENANGKPFGGATVNGVCARFVMTQSPSLGRRDYPRFSYYVKNGSEWIKVTKKDAASKL